MKKIIWTFRPQQIAKEKIDRLQKITGMSRTSLIHLAIMKFNLKGFEDETGKDA